MSILLIGGNGNMGARYRAVLNYIGTEFISLDKEHSQIQIDNAAMMADGIIIATPTYTHIPILKRLYHLKKPILCEKPLSTDVNELGDFLGEMSEAKTNLSMVYQYSTLTTNRGGHGYYDYFKHGTDGLAWDCIQIIGLTNGRCVLREDSPIWTCRIGREKLNIADMDQAYVNFIKSWIAEPGHDMSWLFDVHMEASRQQRDYERSPSGHDRNPGTKH